MTSPEAADPLPPPQPILYAGFAAPLVEMARVWAVPLPELEDPAERKAKLKPFPKTEIEAYGFAPEGGALVFRTSHRIPKEKIQALVGAWSGEEPAEGACLLQAVSPLDLPREEAGLRQAVEGLELRLVIRVGLTYQDLIRDLGELRPELVVLGAHGTKEGCLILEDGRGRAHFVAGDRLFKALRRPPQVLFLSACYSEKVLERAGNPSLGAGTALVTVHGETPIEVPACAAFQSIFFPALLRGESAGAAFELAVDYVEADPMLGAAASPGEVAPAEKLHLAPEGVGLRLEPPTGGDTHRRPVSNRTLETPIPWRRELRRAGDRWAGRRREMQKVIDFLLPLPPGTRGPQGQGEHRLLTLTKEGGIGKTALAAEAAEWCARRRYFPAGILEISCEALRSSEELLSRVLTALGAEQRGDLLAMLRSVLPRIAPLERRLLLVLDNLDDLVAKSAPQEVREGTQALLRTLVEASPGVHVLATCRWPAGVQVHEEVLQVEPLELEEAAEVFRSYLASPAHRAAVAAAMVAPPAASPESDSPIRQLLHLSGRHPQSLMLLAAQMRRPGATFESLRDEARGDLLKVLTDPLAADDDQDRLKKVEMSQELSYRHLSPEARTLFARLSKFPGGILCGELPEIALKWQEFFGKGWKDVLEELDGYALLHYVPDSELPACGTFQILPPMVELAKKKYLASEHPGFEEAWAELWRDTLAAWNQMLSGKLPDDPAASAREMPTIVGRMQLIAKLLFARTQANWLALFQHAVQRSPSLAKGILLKIVGFHQLSGLLVPLKERAEQTVQAQRGVDEPGNLAACLGTLGNAQWALGQRKEALEAFEEVRGIYQDLREQYPGALDGDTAGTLNNLGIVLRDLGRREDARSVFDQALSIYRELEQLSPGAFNQDVAMTLNNLSMVLADLGRSEEALKAYDEALDIRRNLTMVHAGGFNEDVAIILHNRSIVLAVLRRRREAKEGLQEALGIYRGLAEKHPEAFSKYLAGTLNGLGSVLRDEGDEEGAGKCYREALEIFWPLALETPAAHGQNLMSMLRGYTSVTPEAEDDAWWQLWRTFEAAAKEEAQRPEGDPQKEAPEQAEGPPAGADSGV